MTNPIIALDKISEDRAKYALVKTIQENGSPAISLGCQVKSAPGNSILSGLVTSCSYHE